MWCDGINTLDEEIKGLENANIFSHNKAEVEQDHPNDDSLSMFFNTVDNSARLVKFYINQKGKVKGRKPLVSLELLCICRLHFKWSKMLWLCKYVTGYQHLKNMGMQQLVNLASQVACAVYANSIDMLSIDEHGIS